MSKILIEDVQKNLKEMETTSVRLPKDVIVFIRMNNINLRLLICKVVEDLRNE